MVTVPTHLLVPGAAGAVLVDDDGALPRWSLELDDEDTIVIAVLRSLRSAWDFDAIVLETHLPPAPDGATDDQVALAVLEPPDSYWRPPPGMRWGRPPRRLPERIGARASIWLDEWRSQAAPPVLRPRWARPGWHARATAWIGAVLEEAGRPVAGEIEIRRLWGISATARVRTQDGGTAWFKAVFPHFDAEVPVTRFLQTAEPGAVPTVIAANDEAGWLLLDDVGPSPIGLEATEEQLALAIRRLVSLQASMVERTAELRAVGVSERPLRLLADAVATAMNDSAEIEGPSVMPDRLAEVVDWVRRQSDWLAGFGMPETMLHGDFHVFNVIERDGAPVIIDWSDATISHPLLEIGPWFGHPGAPGDPDRAWSTWLEALAALGPVEALRGERDRVFGLASAYQVVSYAAIVRNLEPANRYQLSDGLRDFWALLETAANPTSQ